MSYTLPLSPLDQICRGPLQLAVQVDGERITAVHGGEHWHARGCADRLQQIKLTQSYPLVNRVCGVHSHHHALGWTRALEQLARIEPAPRAQVLRTLVAEAERIVSHLQDVARIVRATGLEREVRPFVALREMAIICTQIITGRRLIPDFVRPGGVQDDLHRDECRTLDAQLVTLGKEVGRLGTALLQNRALRRRATGIGVLHLDDLRNLEVAGWVGRASGLDHDLRSDLPYAAYHLAAFEMIRYEAGDVYARLSTLLGESFVSVVMMRQLLAGLPQSRWRGDLLDHVLPGTTLASVEAPTGPLSYRLSSDGQSLTRVTIDSMQAHLLPLLQLALADASVDDLPLIVTSLGPCTACADV